MAFGFGVEAVKQAYNGGDWNWDLSTWNWWEIGKGLLSFFTAGMYVGSGVWKVGVGAKNTFSSILGRAAGRFILNYVPNYMFENIF